MKYLISALIGGAIGYTVRLAIEDYRANKMVEKIFG